MNLTMDSSFFDFFSNVVKTTFDFFVRNNIQLHKNNVVSSLIFQLLCSVSFSGKAPSKNNKALQI